MVFNATFNYGFTTTYAISAYHHWCCKFESRSRRGVQHYVIKFVSDLRQVDGFLQVFFTNKTDRHDITEILLKVALNTITVNGIQTHDISGDRHWSWRSINIKDTHNTLVPFHHLYITIVYNI
jgi:hypothetical protein